MAHSMGITILGMANMPKIMQLMIASAASWHLPMVKNF